MVRQRSFGSCDVPVVGGICREREVVGQGLVSVKYHRAIDLVVNSGVQPQGREDGFEGQLRHGVLQPECLHRYLAELELAVLRAPLGLADEQVAQGLVEDEEALDGAGCEPHEALRPRDVPHADRVDHGHEVGRDLEVLLQLVELLDELVDVGRGRDVGVVGDDGEHALGHARHRERQLLLDGVHGVLEKGLRLLTEQVVPPSEVKQPRPRPKSRPHGHEVARCAGGLGVSASHLRQSFFRGNGGNQGHGVASGTPCRRRLKAVQDWASSSDGDVLTLTALASSREKSGCACSVQETCRRWVGVDVDVESRLQRRPRRHGGKLRLAGWLKLHVIRHCPANVGLRAAGRAADGPADTCLLDAEFFGKLLQVVQGTRQAPRSHLAPGRAGAGLSVLGQLPLITHLILLSLLEVRPLLAQPHRPPLLRDAAVGLRVERLFVSLEALRCQAAHHALPLVQMKVVVARSGLLRQFRPPYATLLLGWEPYDLAGSMGRFAVYLDIGDRC
mmetsp:Transcript_7752/g.15128  ORF Transcript_7752/g.15128 Transcript_7752/m.15128 type:complete len:503 (+) Transcript_7752:638-2146(+)